jgi:hypothetical protein
MIENPKAIESSQFSIRFSSNRSDFSSEQKNEKLGLNAVRIDKF